MVEIKSPQLAFVWWQNEKWVSLKKKKKKKKKKIFFFFFFFLRETPTSPWVPFRAKFRPPGRPFRPSRPLAWSLSYLTVNFWRKYFVLHYSISSSLVSIHFFGGGVCVCVGGETLWLRWYSFRLGIVGLLVRASLPAESLVLCPWARHYSLLIVLVQTRKDWKSVDWDIKNQTKQTIHFLPVNVTFKEVLFLKVQKVLHCM